MNNVIIRLKLQVFLYKVKKVFSSFFKASGFTLFIVSSVAGMFFFIYKGLSFLNSLGGLGTVIFDKLFYLFFFSLFWLLVVSSGVLFYLCSFRLPEMHFLLTLPLKKREILCGKFLESMFFSSWAFFFVIIPFIYAYAFISGLGPSYYVVSVIFLIPFILCASCLGTILSLIVLFVLRYRVTKYIIGFLVSLGLISLFRNGGALPSEEALFLSRINPLLKVSFYPFSVNFWMAEALRALERNHLRDVVLYFSCLLSTFSVLYILFQYIGEKVFDVCFQWTHFYSRGKRRIRWKIDDVVYRFFKPRWLGAFILKDIKMFLRDPLSWSQFLFFFGLMLVYALNLKNFSYHTLIPMWRNIIIFLNTFAVCIVLASLGTRYVYPQLSLEGLNFWILNTSTVSVRKILFEKFIISFLPSVLVCEGIIVATCLNLDVSPFMMFSVCTLIFIVALGVISICIGMGCIFADFSKTHHLEVISELGGIVTLMATLIYIALATFIMGSLFHLYIKGRILWDIQLWTYRYLSVLFVFTVLASGIFLEAGRISLEKKEF